MTVRHGNARDTHETHLSAGRRRLGLAPGAAAWAEVKIGLLTTLTGPGSVLGQDQLDGFMLAVEQGGGKLGGVPVQVIRKTTSSSPR